MALKRHEQYLCSEQNFVYWPFTPCHAVFATIAWCIGINIIMSGLRASWILATSTDLCCTDTGSALRLVLLTVYAAPIAAIARHHGLIVQLYADDTQLYLTFDIADAPDSISRIESCFLCIRRWMADHKLKFNDEKTILLFLRAPSLGPQPNISGLTIGNNSISCSAFARNLNRSSLRPAP